MEGFLKSKAFAAKQSRSLCIAKVTSRELNNGHADVAAHMDVIDAELGPDPLPLTSVRGAHDIPWRLSLEGVRLNGSGGMAGEIKPMLRLPLR